MSALLATLFEPGATFPDFKPSCIYHPKPLDRLVYLSRDCHYVAHRTTLPELELLMDGDMIVGFKVLGFLSLPRTERFRYLYAAAGVGPDDIENIEAIMLYNALEALPQIVESERQFFEELRRRKTLGILD